MKPSSLHEIQIIRDEIIFMQKKTDIKLMENLEYTLQRSICIKKGKERPFVNFKFTRNRD